MKKQNFLEKVLTARVYDVAKETPIDSLALLSTRFDNKILLKREDTQPVFSFKLRGAFNKLFHMLSVSPDLKGVIAASAGNHAQGVALAAQKLGLKATIVMPETTPEIKVKAVKFYGAKAILVGDNFNAAYDYAIKLAQEKSLAFIHPYDDIDVIAGQGTIGLEILRQYTEEIHAIFVPVGGGGLFAGIATFIKAVKPSIKMIAVEPEDAACLYAAMKSNRRVKLDNVGIFADGVAVNQIGKTTFNMIREIVDEVITVSTDQICAAIKDTFEDTRSICEPAGAIALAGLKKYIEQSNAKGKTLLAINSGANMNFDRLRHVSERSEIGEQREALLAVKLLEQPGSFMRFCKIIGKRQITEFNYRYADDKEAIVFAGVTLRKGLAEKNELVKQLSNKGYEVIDMTENEVAKLHTRYMVGGHPGTSVTNEVLYRFQFPENPGALLGFLMKLGKRWNISLFHYRNHGSNFGRVLIGFQVDKQDFDVFNEFLSGLDISYSDETRNQAYQLFLK